MLDLVIESILSLLEAPLTGIGISPVAVLRGVELFVTSYAYHSVPALPPSFADM